MDATSGTVALAIVGLFPAVAVGVFMAMRARGSRRRRLSLLPIALAFGAVGQRSETVALW